MLIVRDRELPVNIQEELEVFDLHRAEIKGEKLLACSPFRDERRPSFAIHLVEGTYIDSGSNDEYWRKGNLQKLLVYLTGQDLSEVEDYLIEKYSPFHMKLEDMELSLNLIEEKPVYDEITAEMLAGYNHPNLYLITERRLKEEVLRHCLVGFSPSASASTFVWCNKAGKPVNIKFRKNDTKRFFYLPKGEPIKHHIYNLHHVFKKKPKRIYITESEIDALYINGLGENYIAVALGGANLSSEQEKLLLSAPYSEIVLCFDNDEAGKRITNYVKKKLLGFKDVYTIKLPDYVKDVNELNDTELKFVIGQPVFEGFSFVNFS